MLNTCYIVSKNVSPAYCLMMIILFAVQPVKMLHSSISAIRGIPVFGLRIQMKLEGESEELVVLHNGIS